MILQLAGAILYGLTLAAISALLFVADDLEQRQRWQDIDL